MTTSQVTYFAPIIEQTNDHITIGDERETKHISTDKILFIREYHARPGYYFITVAK